MQASMAALTGVRMASESLSVEVSKTRRRVHSQTILWPANCWTSLSLKCRASFTCPVLDSNESYKQPHWQTYDYMYDDMLYTCMLTLGWGLLKAARQSARNWKKTSQTYHSMRCYCAHHIFLFLFILRPEIGLENIYRENWQTKQVESYVLR